MPGSVCLMFILLNTNAYLHSYITHGGRLLYVIYFSAALAGLLAYADVNPLNGALHMSVLHACIVLGVAWYDLQCLHQYIFLVVAEYADAITYYFSASAFASVFAAGGADAGVNSAFIVVGEGGAGGTGDLFIMSVK